MTPMIAMLLLALVGLVVYQCPTPALFGWLALVALSGCGLAKEAVTVIEVQRDALNAAQPCIVAAVEREVSACEQAPNPALCVSQVHSVWDPIAEAYDTAHTAWCTLWPDSEGCAR